MNKVIGRAPRGRYQTGTFFQSTRDLDRYAIISWDGNQFLLVSLDDGSAIGRSVSHIENIQHHASKFGFEICPAGTELMIAVNLP